MINCSRFSNVKSKDDGKILIAAVRRNGGKETGKIKDLSKIN